MDYRSVGFGSDGNSEIVLVVLTVWLAVFVFVRMRKAATGRDGNVGDLTFSVLINLLMGIFLAGAALVPAFLISGVLMVGYTAATGQDVHDLIDLHRWLLGGTFVVCAGAILWWLRGAREA